MLILRHGEIFTKSEFVRKEFIRRLINNLRLALPGIKVVDKMWRIFVYDDSEKTIDIIKHVFGVVSFSKAIECEADLNKIKEVVSGFIPNEGSFAVDTHRIDKTFPLTSQQVNEIIGEFVLNKRKLKVDLKNPDLRIGIEIYKGSAFVFTETYEGAGGLPLGSAKLRLECDFKNDLDVAGAWMMMKRGVVVTPFNKKLSKWSSGFTEGKAVAKVIGCLDVNEYVKLQKQTKEVLFNPLIGFTKKQAEELVEKVLK